MDLTRDRRWIEGARWGAVAATIVLVAWWVPHGELAAAAVLLMHACFRLGLWVGDPGASGARLWSPRSASIVFVTLLWHACLLTHFGGGLFEVELHGWAFDSLAESLWRGESGVDPRAIRWEGMRVGERTVMYFGLWPALLRMASSPIAPELLGLWPRLSCFLASAFAVHGFGLLAMRRLAANAALDDVWRGRLLDACWLGFGLGTPLAFVVFAATLYNEAVIWAFSLAVHALHHGLRCLDEQDTGAFTLTAFGFFAGAALLARLTFGVPLVGSFAVVSLRALLRAVRGGADPSGVRGRRLLRLAACSLPLVFALGLQLWYNADRFGSVFETADYHLLRYFENDRESFSAYLEHGAVSPARWPTAARNLFGVRSEYFRAGFPFVQVARPAYPGTGLYPQMFNSHVISLLLVSPWLLLGSAAGAHLAWQRGLDPWRSLVALGLLAQLLLVMGFMIMEQRYLLDALMFPLFAFAYLLSDLGLRPPWNPRRCRGAVWGMAILALWSAVATSLSTLSEIPVSGKQVGREYKREWAARFERVDAALGLSAPASPAEAPGRGASRLDRLL